MSRGPRGWGTRAARRQERERGSAIVEFIGVGVLLGVPLFYLAIALAGLHSAALAATTMAQQLASIQAQSPDAATAERRVAQARGEMAGAAGVDADAVRVSIECDRPCPGPQARVRVSVRITVSLPLVPSSGGVASVESSATVLSPRYG